MYILQYNQMTYEIYGIYNSIECLLAGVDKLITESSNTLKENTNDHWCHESLNTPCGNNHLYLKISVWKSNDDFKTILISNINDYNNLSLSLTQPGLTQ